MDMYTYTLAFIKYQESILMLNRSKSPWLGMWNGLGGKIQPEETPLQSIQRELHEEMGVFFDSSHIHDVGILTWNDFDAQGQGIHMYMIELEKPLEGLFPRQTEEGILAMKSIAWILKENNLGVAPNIRHFLPNILKFERIHAHCFFQDKRLMKVTINKL